jgi:glucokinase
MKYVGVDIGGTNLKAGLVDESGTLLATQKMKVASIVDREGLAWTVASLVQELAKAANIPVSDVASVGVGVPGTVDIRAGSIAYTCNLPLRDVPLRKLFHKYLNIPLYIENDANCAALAEFHVGAGRESKRFVTITLGTGVGAGIIHNGKIYHGANGMAGEAVPLWAARLLGAIRQRHGVEAHDGRGTGGLPGQYSGAGHHGE